MAQKFGSRNQSILYRAYSGLRVFLVPYIALFLGCSGADGPAEEENEVPAFNASSYVSAQTGYMPLIISVPHGGSERPESIPDRSCNDAVNVMDEFTIELSEAIMLAFAEKGYRPYIIVNHLHRSKMDANRNRADASCGHPHAQEVWDIFHSEVKKSRDEVIRTFERGLYLDLHGHGNPKQRVELGYLLFDDELALSPEELNSDALVSVSAIQNLVRNNRREAAHVSLLKGAEAFGSLLHNKGFPAVPSLTDPVPLASDNYFSGGYNTAQYSSYNGGTVDGIQVECHRTGLRETAQQRALFAAAFTEVVVTYLETFYFDEIPVNE